MHDRWASYDQYDCDHSLCGAHLLRDCTSVTEREQEPWSQEMEDLLMAMVEAAHQWRARGAEAIPKDERDGWIAKYFDILAAGYAAQAPPMADTPFPSTKGDKSKVHPRICSMSS